MRQYLASAVLGCVMVAGAVDVRAQDPIKTLPQNYWVEFKNAWAKVIHVRYRAHEKVGVHDHPPTPTLYVYLSDSGPVKFEHAGKDDFDITRPPLKTGQMRLSPGRMETHRVENLGDLQSDFLRVELKSIALGKIKDEKRIAAADAAFWASPERKRVEFEDSHLRVTRVGVQAGQHDVLRGVPRVRTLWLAVRVDGAQVAGKNAHAGEAWDSGTLEVSAGAQRVELVRLDVK
jgi:hypothetical protein